MSDENHQLQKPPQEFFDAIQSYKDIAKIITKATGSKAFTFNKFLEILELKPEEGKPVFNIMWELCFIRQITYTQNSTDGKFLVIHNDDQRKTEIKKRLEELAAEHKGIMELMRHLGQILAYDFEEEKS
jgi:hypothetical protein